jgi:Fur family transcriptional regulator, peroxide stress response regulator
MSQERLTSQKQIISDYLMSTKSHPTAEDVWLSVRKKLPRISQGTVYRILNDFEEKGLAQIIPVDKKAHFDGDISPHSHFICQKCKKVFDVYDSCSKCSVLKNKKLKVGKINYYKIYFYGICEKCAQMS